MSKQHEYLTKQLGKLIGKTIVDISVDDDGDDLFPGFQLDDGTSVWVLRDPEGNGPGYLQITDG